MKKAIGENTQKNDEQSKLTRRKFFDRMMLTALGGAALMMTGTSEAEAKIAKMRAKYRSSPYKGRKCSGCRNYRGSGKCAIVAGTVSANGYCNYYARNSSAY